MKITHDAHKKLQLAKVNLDVKTLSDAIEELAARYLELLSSKGKR